MKTNDGRLMIKVLSDAGIIPGIKVDTGANAIMQLCRENTLQNGDGNMKQCAAILKFSRYYNSNFFLCHFQDE